MASPQSPHVLAVIFDLDGLMADSESLAEWSWDQVLQRYGHKLDTQTLQSILGLRVIDSARELCQRFQLPLDPEEAAGARDELFLKAVPSQLKACPGLYPLLEELEIRRMPLGVATSGHKRYVELALQTLDIQHRFQAIARGDEVERGKPDPEVYLLASNRLGVEPSRCLVLEDAPLGVAAAVAAGMRCAAVPNPRVPRPEFSAAHYVFHSLTEVHNALESLLYTPHDSNLDGS
jgi:pseudouridine-5'-monophosphatase